MTNPCDIGICDPERCNDPTCGTEPTEQPTPDTTESTDSDITDETSV